MLGSHLIKSWSSTQGALALSSAEAEYYSMVEGVLRSKGLISVARDIGIEGNNGGIRLGVKEDELEMVLCTDSSAARSFASRGGLGKIRHMEVKWLWLQGEIKRGAVEVHKVKGTENPADILTKYLRREELAKALSRMDLLMDSEDDERRAEE